MKTLGFKKRDIKYIVVLLVCAVFMVTGFVEGAKDAAEYNRLSQNAVTVTAFVEDSFMSVREEVDWDSGAGDDVDKTVTKIPYYTHRVSYTYEGKEYTGTYGGYYHTTDLAKGTPVEIVIDASNPEQQIDGKPTGKGNFASACIFLCIFLAVLITWLIRRKKYHK